MIEEIYKRPDGSYVTNPHWVDYHDRKGRQLCGGMSYDANGKAIGHIDPPGPQGPSGITQYRIIVAHPDDEIIFAGEYLYNNRSTKVVCLTNGTNRIRRQEFERVMDKIGCPYEICNYTDTGRGFLESDLKDINQRFGNQSGGYDIISHNPTGEYGHIHHKQLNKCLSPAKHFYLGEQLPKEIVEWKLDLLDIYVSQRKVLAREDIKEWINRGRIT